MRKLFLLFMALFSLRSSANQDACLALFAPSKHELEVSLAEKAGLHYSTQIERGYSRAIAEDKTAIYTDADGNVVSDVEIRSRIAKLAIPPGYSNVWIAEDPLAHLQAKGYDAKSRPQYRYHEIWTSSVLTEAKFSRMRDFGANISKLRLKAEQDLRNPLVDRNSQLAAVVRLLEISNIRIGSERYAEENGSFGLSTLEVRHVEISGPEIHFQFIAKEGIAQNILVVDSEVAKVIKFLITEKSRSDAIFDVTAAEVNSYIKASMGNNFSAKDFRTWIGTTTAVETLSEIGFQNDKKKIASAIKIACESVATKLHNTPAVAKASYISPKVLAAYTSGELDAAFTETSDPLLSPAENAVLVLELTR